MFQKATGLISFKFCGGLEHNPWVPLDFEADPDKWEDTDIFFNTAR